VLSGADNEDVANYSWLIALMYSPAAALVGGVIGTLIGAVMDWREGQKSPLRLFCLVAGVVLLVGGSLGGHLVFLRWSRGHPAFPRSLAPQRESVYWHDGHWLTRLGWSRTTPRSRQRGLQVFYVFQPRLRVNGLPLPSSAQYRLWIPPKARQFRRLQSVLKPHVSGRHQPKVP
jgi:MFS family permease